MLPVVDFSNPQNDPPVGEKADEDNYQGGPWRMPEGPYTAECPIGNPYCTQEGGSGWACWDWAESHQPEKPKPEEKAERGIPNSGRNSSG